MLRGIIEKVLQCFAVLAPQRQSASCVMAVRLQQQQRVYFCGCAGMKAMFVILLLINFIAAAQDTATQNIISFSTGASFPIGDFASTQLNNINSGMAATGYSLEIKYNHLFNELFGFATAFSYNHHMVNVPAGNENSDIKPWTSYQILFGPMISGQVGQRLNLDISAYTGTAFINAPKLNVNEQVIAEKHSTTAIPLKAAADARYFIGHQMFLFSGVSYTYLHARFNVSVEGQDLSFKQRMNTIDISAGLGFRL